MVDWRNTAAALFLAVICCCCVCPANCDNNNEFLKRLVSKSQQLMNKIIKRQHAEPGPIIVPNFVSNEEAEAILQRYEHLLRPSAHVMSAQVRSNDKYRTSKSVRLPPIG